MPPRAYGFLLAPAAWARRRQNNGSAAWRRCSPPESEYGLTAMGCAARRPARDAVCALCAAGAKSRGLGAGEGGHLQQRDGPADERAECHGVCANRAAVRGSGARWRLGCCATRRAAAHAPCSGSRRWRRAARSASGSRTAAAATPGSRARSCRTRQGESGEALALGGGRGGDGGGREGVAGGGGRWHPGAIGATMDAG
jgi:hypothetical protein